MQSTEAVWYFSMQAATLQEKESMMAKVQVQSVEKYVQQIDARQHRLAAGTAARLPVGRQTDLHCVQTWC